MEIVGLTLLHVDVVLEVHDGSGLIGFLSDVILPTPCEVLIEAVIA